MKKFIFIFIIITNLSCSKSKSDKGVYVETLNAIVLLNKSGQNLLNPNTPNYYVHDSIETFKTDINGNKIVLQKNLVKSTTENPYFLCITEFGISDSNLSESTIFLKLNQTDVDTIKVEYKIESGNLFNAKLWYNGELKWEKWNNNLIIIEKNK